MLKRLGDKVEMRHGRDVWWDDVGAAPKSAIANRCTSIREHPLFTLYTSGTTGKPKGVVHTTGGYLTHLLTTMKWVFDLKEEDIYWCTADVGWVTGHSYVVYGPLAAGATVVMYEGAPNFPENDRFWAIIEKYRVNILYTAPTAIRTFIKWGEAWVKKHDLSSLRLLGTVGEPINPEAWIWYHKVIGGERCPIVDTWWQTETGGIMIAPITGRDRDETRVRRLVRCRGSRPKSSRAKAVTVAPNQGGLLVVKRPWPGMLRTIFRDPERYQQAVLQPDRRHVFHRRRRPARRGRLLLDHGPRRRRDQRLGPSAGHDGNRERAGLASDGGRGRGGRPSG